MTEHTLESLLALYREKAEYQMKLTDKTLAAYWHWNRAFLNYLKEANPEPTLSDFTKKNALNFREVRTREREYMPRTYNSITSAIKNFGAWLVDSEYLSFNPIADLKRRTPERSDRALLTEEEALRILPACLFVKDEFRRLMMRALIATLMHSGIRRGELIALTVRDYDPTISQLRIRVGKGRKYREVPICREACECLDAYLLKHKSVVDDLPALPREPLFYGKGSKVMGEAYLKGLIDEALRMAHIDKHVTPHTFRHYYATTLINRSSDVLAVSGLMGHSSAKTTLDTYAHTYTANMRAVANLSGPQVIKPEPTREPEPVYAFSSLASEKERKQAQPERRAAWRRPLPVAPAPKGRTSRAGKAKSKPASVLNLATLPRPKRRAAR